VEVPARTSLRQTRLDPRRDAIRRTVLWLALGVAGLVMILLLFEEHETEYVSRHSTIGEDLEHALVVWGVGALVACMLVLALRFGLAMGILAGIVTGLGGFVMLVAAAVVHILSDVAHNGAGQAMLLGCIALCVLGLAIIVVEVLTRVTQRADDRRAAAAELPRAIVVEK
jgi:hypothetical protein